VLFAGSLLVIAGAGFASDVFGLPEFGSRVLGNLLLAAIGVAGAAVVGLRSIRETMPFRPRATDLGWALAAAAGGAVAGALWIGLFRALGPDGPDPATPEDPLILRLVAIAVFPAVVEEWLCRGVLWRPLRPLLSPGITILVTAILFAFLHGLGDGYLLEIPHRFVGGLLFGFIRERSGSLSAPMLAHFEHNAFWVLIGRA
jgi:membrane protease YdiL (CAAX protease family)